MISELRTVLALAVCNAVTSVELNAVLGAQIHRSASDPSANREAAFRDITFRTYDPNVPVFSCGVSCPLRV